MMLRQNIWQQQCFCKTDKSPALGLRAWGVWLGNHEPTRRERRLETEAEAQHRCSLPPQRRRAPPRTPSKSGRCHGWDMDALWKRMEFVWTSSLSSWLGHGCFVVTDGVCVGVIMVGTRMLCGNGWSLCGRCHACGTGAVARCAADPSFW